MCITWRSLTLSQFVALSLRPLKSGMNFVSLHLRPWSEPLTMGGPIADELCATVSSETWEKRRASPFQHWWGSPFPKGLREKSFVCKFLRKFFMLVFFLLFSVLFPTKYQCHVRFKNLSRARRVNLVSKKCNGTGVCFSFNECF